MDEPHYVAPPAFAPPELRVAPLNEVAVLGGTSYPQPPATYGQPRWQPYYGQPNYGQPLGVTWPTPRTEPGARRRRNVSVLISLCVVVALVTIVAVLATSLGGQPQHTLSLPETVDGYSRVSTLSGVQVQSLFTAGAATFRGVGNDDLGSALVAVYGTVDDTVPSMLFIGFRADDSPTIGAGLHAGPATTVAEQVLDGAGAAASPQSVDAGPLGGAMRCATIYLDGSPASVGVWADHDTLGILLLDDSVLSAHSAAVSTQRTGRVTRDFRAAAEH